MKCDERKLASSRVNTACRSSHSNNSRKIFKIAVQLFSCHNSATSESFFSLRQQRQRPLAMHQHIAEMPKSFFYSFCFLDSKYHSKFNIMSRALQPNKSSPKTHKTALLTRLLESALRLWPKFIVEDGEMQTSSTKFFLLNLNFQLLFAFIKLVCKECKRMDEWRDSIERIERHFDDIIRND